MLTSTALTALKNCILTNVAYARYKVGSSYYEAPIRSASILGDGRVAITFLIDHTISGDITVTEVQLYNHNGVLWASKAESITRRAVVEGILYRFAFTITES
jgi:hypothetical protein